MEAKENSVNKQTKIPYKKWQLCLLTYLQHIMSPSHVKSRKLLTKDPHHLGVLPQLVNHVHHPLRDASLRKPHLPPRRKP